MHMRRFILGISIALATSVLVFGALTYRVLTTACSRSQRAECTLIRKKGAALFKAAGAKPISFNTSDGLKLAGYLIERPQAQRVLLFCHGFWQAKEFLHDYITLFPDDTLLFFDFRAHGESEGTYISFGCHESKDVQAAYKYIKQHKSLQVLPVYGLGFSMGTAVLLKAAAEADGLDFKALVLDSGFASLAVQTRRLFARVTALPACCFSLTRPLIEYWLEAPLHAVDPIACLRKLRIPVLFIHSEKDTIIPVADSHELYAAAASEKKQLWVASNAGHVKTHITYPQEYYRRVTQFFA